MQYAKINNTRELATETGQRGKCPVCTQRVDSVCGTNKINHWRHFVKCTDNWRYEPMSHWHLEWQSHFPKENLEVVCKDSETGEKHIADIMTNDNVVIEIQNSPISQKEIDSRDDYYNRNGKRLIWVLNGQNLGLKVEEKPIIKTIYNTKEIKKKKILGMLLVGERLETKP